MKNEEFDKELRVDLEGILCKAHPNGFEFIEMKFVSGSPSQLRYNVLLKVDGQDETYNFSILPGVPKVYSVEGALTPFGNQHYSEMEEFGQVLAKAFG